MEIYATELATYKRDTRLFRRRNYERHCKNKGIQPLSRSRINLVQMVAALSLPVLAIQAYA